MIKKVTIVLAIMMALVPAAIAGQIQIGYSGSLYGPYTSGVGGEFTLNPINPAGWLDLSGYVAGITKGIGTSTTFQSFCVEGAEYINGFGATYDAVLSTNAVAGGVGPTGDPVSKGTGWLYKQFATTIWEGSLTYIYNTGGISAGLLQNAIWWLEGEKGIGYDGSNAYMAAVVTKFGSEAGAKADGAWLYGVSALNLKTGSTLAQDQLYYSIPDGGTTVVLLGIAFACLAFVFRRASI